MEIDKETKPQHFSITLDNNSPYMNVLKNQADEDGQNEEKGDNRISLTMDKHVFQTEEYYFDERDKTIIISGNMVSDKGESWVSISMPLSDIVLIDILKYSMNKLDNLKTALEVLK
ncbi:hypothetical protein LCGC14_0556410 [marine sediment metagenome]|uniref:Uncharacterized protein n=1 Tax=marine sediment metagenome TaxID=412755 RepID=A0A0F9UWH5_9ZZZZ